MSAQPESPAVQRPWWHAHGQVQKIVGSLWITFGALEFIQQYVTRVGRDTPVALGWSTPVLLLSAALAVVVGLYFLLRQDRRRGAASDDGSSRQPYGLLVAPGLLVAAQLLGMVVTILER